MESVQIREGDEYYKRLMKKITSVSIYNVIFNQDETEITEISFLLGRLLVKIKYYCKHGNSYVYDVLIYEEEELIAIVKEVLTRELAEIFRRVRKEASENSRNRLQEKKASLEKTLQ